MTEGARPARGSTDPGTALPEDLQGRANANAVLRRLGQYMNAEMLIAIGDNEWLIEIMHGAVGEVRKGPFLMQSRDFSIRFSVEAWHEFMKPVPRPGYHDLFAMTKSGEAVIEGNLVPLMANLRYVKELLGSLRSTTNPET